MRRGGDFITETSNTGEGKRWKSAEEIRNEDLKKNKIRGNLDVISTKVNKMEDSELGSTLRSLQAISGLGPSDLEHSPGETI